MEENSFLAPIIMFWSKMDLCCVVEILISPALTKGSAGLISVSLSIG